MRCFGGLYSPPGYKQVEWWRFGPGRGEKHRLSGGEKQRVQLAGAVYNDLDIFFP